MGPNFQDHDRFAVESEGPIFTTERLGTSDTGASTMRRQMLEAIADLQAGRAPLSLAPDGESDPVAELVVRSLRLPNDAPVLGFWQSPAPT